MEGSDVTATFSSWSLLPVIVFLSVIGEYKVFIEISFTGLLGSDKVRGGCSLVHLKSLCGRWEDVNSLNVWSPTDFPQTDEATWISCEATRKKVQLPWLVHCSFSLPAVFKKIKQDFFFSILAAESGVFHFLPQHLNASDVLREDDVTNGPAGRLSGFSSFPLFPFDVFVFKIISSVRGKHFIIFSVE